MTKQKNLFKGIIIVAQASLILFDVRLVRAQASGDDAGCIQGIWQGITIDIEPTKDMSSFFQIIQGNSIYSFYSDKNGIFKSEFRFIDFDIQKEGVGFYDVEETSLLSVGEESNDDYLYTEMDSKGNIAVDKFFFCGMDYMTKLHFEFERLHFMPYSIYQHLAEQIANNKSNYLSEYDALDLLKKVKVVTERAYFYDAPNDETRRKAFVVKNDELIINAIANDWIEAAYEGKDKTTLGWLKPSDVEVLD